MSDRTMDTTADTETGRSVREADKEVSRTAVSPETDAPRLGRSDDAHACREVTMHVPTADAMRSLGERIAGVVRGGDVILLSGPLGAGKTTFAQGFGAGLGIDAPIVSPTFTIARELDGRFHDGTPAHLVHVDAYRLGGQGYEPGQDSVGRLLDELEALGLDEELEDPHDDTVVLMEWGEQMVAALAADRLQIHIARPLAPSDGLSEVTESSGDALSDAGERLVTLVPVGPSWSERPMAGL